MQGDFLFFPTVSGIRGSLCGMRSNQLQQLFAGFRSRAIARILDLDLCDNVSKHRLALDTMSGTVCLVSVIVGCGISSLIEPGLGSDFASSVSMAGVFTAPPCT